MKTARFTDVVKKGGAPQTHALWVPPNQDREFQRALKQHRILTIHRENVGTKKDYGQVGFVETSNAQYLIFPKSLKSFAERRVVGINYDLLAGQPAPRRNTRPGAPKKVEKRPSKRSAEKRESDVSSPAGGKESDKIVAFQASAEKIETAPSDTPTKPVRPKKTPKVSAKTAPPLAKESSTAEKERHAGPPVDAKVRRVILRALKDLDAGKTVAAYKRLEALVTKAVKHAD